MDFVDRVGYETTAYPRVLSPALRQRLERARETMRCFACRQIISLKCPVTVNENGYTFHPSCRERAERREREEAVATPVTRRPRAIGIVHGTACTFGRLEVFSDRREVISPGAFTRTLRDGRSKHLLVDHDRGQAIPCVLTFCGRLDRLCYYASLYESPIARATLEKAARGAYQGVSLRFNAKQTAYDRFMNATVLEDVDLIEVSLCSAKQPAWGSTSVNATSAL